MHVQVMLEGLGHLLIIAGGLHALYVVSIYQALHLFVPDQSKSNKILRKGLV